MPKPPTLNELRWGAHKAIERLEWLDKHVTTRQSKHMKQLQRELRELQVYLIRVATFEENLA